MAKYQKADFAAVPQIEFVLNSKARRIIEDNWPTTVVQDDDGNDVSVFGDIRLAVDEHYDTVTMNDPKILKIFKLFGMDKEDITTEDWKGHSDARFKIQHITATSAIKKSSIYNEIASHSRVGVPCSAHLEYIVYGETLPDLSSINTDIANGTMTTGKLNALKTTDEEDIAADGFVNEDDRNWYIAYADIDQKAFTRKVTIKTPKIQVHNKSGSTYSYVYSYPVIIEYTLNPLDTIPVAIDMDDVLSRVKTNDVYDRDFLDNYLDLDTDGNVVNDGYLRVIDRPATIDDYGEITPATYRYYLRTDAAANMKLKTFAKVFKDAIKFDYTYKKAPWWVKVVTVIVIVILIVITIWSAGTAAPAAGATFTAFLAGISAMAGVVAMGAAVIALGLSLLYKALENQGYYGDLALVGRTMVIFQDIAKYAGYLSMLTGGIAAISSGFTTTITAGVGEVAGEGVYTTGGVEVVKDTALTKGTEYVVDMSASQIARMVVTWVSTIGNIVLEELPDYSDEIADKNTIISNQNELFDNYYGTPKALVVSQYNFDSYAALDSNAKIDNYPHKMTQGLIEGSTTKYYD